MYHIWGGGRGMREKPVKTTLFDTLVWFILKAGLNLHITL